MNITPLGDYQVVTKGFNPPGTFVVYCINDIVQEMIFQYVINSGAAEAGFQTSGGGDPMVEVRVRQLYVFDDVAKMIHAYAKEQGWKRVE